MKKAIVVGGGSGVGLAIAKILMDKNYKVIIVNKGEPDPAAIGDYYNYEFVYTDLNYFDRDLFIELSKDLEVDTLMITAGFGRVAGFEYLHTSEIESLMRVNATAGIEIISCFYERLKSKESFDCGMISSIAGLMSSPLFSVYAASKAAICRFIESVNIELEMNGINNRILNVSPASIPGTKFNGGLNEPSLVKELASQIVDRMTNKEEMFIPNYTETFKGVLERYHDNPHEYGIYSYKYKEKSGRVFNEKRVKIGYLSGTFDLFHVGHLNLLRRAKEQCDYLIVGVHDSGKWKGKETFIPLGERKQIVAACKYVDKVVDSCREDSDAWNLWHYDCLFVGSDYKGTERFNRYEEYFKDKGVEIIYFPYTKSTSSTQIRNAVAAKTKIKDIGACRQCDQPSVNLRKNLKLQLKEDSCQS